MKTAGNLIRSKRYELNISRDELGEMTHIKTNFIKAIEESDWEKLPELAVLAGFVKSISHFLNIDENLAMALLRREYKLPENPIKLKTKEIEKKFVWGPRLTFLAGILIVILIVFGYLGIQYKKFNSPPSLVLNTPKEGQLIESKSVEVAGKTDPDATLEVNNQPILVEDNGEFKGELNVSSSTHEVRVIAKSRSGKVTVISRTIKVVK